MYKQIPGSFEGRYRKHYENLNCTLNDILPGANNLARWSEGQAEAAVCLQQNECYWGSWKQQKAGILHFFTTRYEPQGFKLSTLTTELLFHEEGLQPDQSSSPDSMSSPNVYILDRPAPTIVVPRGLHKHEEQSSWRYSSFLKGEGQRYTTAIWYWETGTGSHRLGDLHGAVLVCHDDIPFYVRCKLEGRLVSTKADVWSVGRRILKFVSRTAVEGQFFRLKPSVDQKRRDLENSVVNMHRKVENLIHGTEIDEEPSNMQQLQSYPDLADPERYSQCESKRRKTWVDPELNMFIPEKYSIAIVCALPKELMAVRLVFDHLHLSPKIDGADTNTYIFGTISQHNVVATCLPSGSYGNSSATDVASQLRRSFPQVELCLLVGIGGGIPSRFRDIRLGDVVVSDPGIIKYDFEKVMENGVFQQIGTLQPAPRRLLASISNLNSNPDLGIEPLRPYLDSIASRTPMYCHPGLEKDILFMASYRHINIDSNDGTCLHCNGPSVNRSARLSTHPVVHYGLIASGDKLMKNAQIRDEIGIKHNALCIEMEGAGIANVLPCLSIRGISDYSDSHKHNIWQEYACASAASYAKLLLTHTRHFQPPD